MINYDFAYGNISTVNQLGINNSVVIIPRCIATHKTRSLIAATLSRAVQHVLSSLPVA